MRYKGYVALPRSSCPPFAEAQAPDWDLEAVYRRYAPDVARWAGRWAGPTVQVDDLVHEVFLVVQRRLPEFRGDAQITTWLYRITANVVRHQRRRAKVRSWFGMDEAREPVDPQAGPLEQVESRQALLRVYQITERLPEQQRRALLLHVLEGLSGPEIAELEGVATKTVWVWIHRARKRFKAELGTKEHRP